MPDTPGGLTEQICARQSQLDTDELGQVHFFGLTSIPHTAENGTLPFTHRNMFAMNRDGLFDDDIPLRLQ